MADIKIGKITLGMCQTNCYFLYKEGSSEVIFVDPADSGDYICEKLAEKGFSVKAILLTHGHFDHILGVSAMKAKSGAKVYALEEERELLMNSHINLSNSMGKPVIVEADNYLKDGEEVTLCDMTFKVIHTPGHTEGSCCFYFEEAGILVAGDTLFFESVGRSDFPTGSGKKLIEAINTKLMELPDSVKVYPGHGGTTTIGNERENNPFL